MYCVKKKLIERGLWNSSWVKNLPVRPLAPGRKTPGQLYPAFRPPGQGQKFVIWSSMIYYIIKETNFLFISATYYYFYEGWWNDEIRALPGCSGLEIKIFKSLLRQIWKSQKETQKIRLMMKVSETIFWVQWTYSPPLLWNKNNIFWYLI